MQTFKVTVGTPDGESHTLSFMWDVDVMDALNIVWDLAGQPNKFSTSIEGI